MCCNTKADEYLIRAQRNPRSECPSEGWRRQGVLASTDPFYPRVPQILVSLEEYFVKEPLESRTFNHYRPSRYFTENIAALRNVPTLPHSEIRVDLRKAASLIVFT
jgi:hypothetical protein